MFAPAGPEPIVAIKAGKCKVEPHRDEAKRAAGKLWITPQKDRGEVIVVKKDDVNHFQWRSREMPCAVDPNIDTMVFPGDAEFQRTSTGRDEDRVYILQFKAQEDRRFFFWMQDADDSNDKELVEKLNKALNGDGADLGASLRALRNNPAPAPAGQAPLSLDNIQDVFASLDMPAAAPAPAGSVDSDALARSLAAAMSSQQQRVSLGDVATGDAVDASGVLNDSSVVQRLLEHLPESQRNVDELKTLIRAPQFRQALSQLTSALLTPENYASILANFGLEAAPLTGDPVQSFLDAITKAVEKDGDGDAKMDDA